MPVSPTLLFGKSFQNYKSEVTNLLNHRDVQPPILLILSGPSGVGKDAVLSRMRDLEAVSYTHLTLPTKRIV